MFVVFEGIDGSGKTTLSNGVAKKLREGGLTVEHVREGGTFASAVTQQIRELGRDSRNLELTPFAELFLFAARDVQLFEEATRPALDRAHIVFADRFLYTAEVLARYGRGLPEAEIMPILKTAARGVVPDLVILVDVDPHVARARRQVAKIVKPDPRPPSRKGLTGVGLQHRLREGYLEIAKREPDRFIVVDNTDADLEALTKALAEIVVTARKASVAEAKKKAAEIVPRKLTPPVLAGAEDALAAFLGWVDRRGPKEPDLAAYFLGGLYGKGIDERRLAMAEKSPAVIAAGLTALTDEVSVRLRSFLAEAAPSQVARSLQWPAAKDVAGRRLQLELARLVPADVAMALDGRDDAQAWLLREAIYPVAPDPVVQSLERVGTPRSWALRNSWLVSRGGPDSLKAYELARVAVLSVLGIDDDRAWEIRKVARVSAPVAAIESLTGLKSEWAWKWRQKYLARAPKIVMKSIFGLDEPRAWKLREEVAARCKEALDSMVGLDGDAAWRIRRDCADVWPSTVVKSLGALAGSAQGKEILARQLARHAGNISLLKHAAAIAAGVDPGGFDA